MNRDSKPAHAPVKDWATDFDHRDPSWIENPFPIWDELRGRCPVAHSERFEDGAYFPSRYAEVREIAYDSEHFSSRRVIVRENKVPLTPSPPITSDPPEHTPARKLLLPAFAPHAIARLEPQGPRAVPRAAGRDRRRQDLRCGGRLRAAHPGAPDRPHARGAGAGRRPVPPLDPPGARGRHQRRIGDHADAAGNGAYFTAEIKKRGTQRGDDLISFLLDAKMEGQPLSDPHLLGTLRLLLIAGIDTTWSAIGASLWHLATHRGGPAQAGRGSVAHADGDRGIPARLRAGHDGARGGEGNDGGRLPVQGEAGRCCCRSRPRTAIRRCSPRRTSVLIDRAENRHAAFGLGRHRCIGSNLARLEMTVAIEEWLARFPEFRLADGAKVTWSEGTVRGPRRLPVALN